MNKIIHMIAFLLVIVGALNWGLVGVADINLVNKLLGAYPYAEKAVYALVGLSALWLVVFHSQECKYCHQ